MLTGKNIKINGLLAKRLYEYHLKNDVTTPAFSPGDLERLHNFYPLQIIKTSELQNLEKVNAQGSSKVYNGDLNGNKYFVKDVVKSGQLRRNKYNAWDLELALNEVLASVVYNNIYHVDAVRLFLVVNDNSCANLPKYLVGSKAIPNIRTSRLKDTESSVEGILQPFLVDCIVANWDVCQTGNIGVLDKSHAIRIDVGGSLMFRAQGKARDFSEIPNEHMTFLTKDRKMVSNRIFRRMTKPNILSSFDCIEFIDPKSFARLKTRFYEQVRFLKGDEYAQASYAIESIDVVKKRHLFYICNKSRVIASMLESI